MSQSEPAFFVAGGTLSLDAASYVERQADRDILRWLQQGEFCYVLTSRQMGKSSLMVRTSRRLRQEAVQVIALDLTAIGLNVTPEQWYDGLLLRLGAQLRLEEDLEAFWQERQRLGPVQRFFGALREVALPRLPGALVVFIDEIDTVRSLPFSTDEFFAAIRECQNRRTEDPEFQRLTFCLLGVATPSELIRDTRTTPFNIGRRVELTDFNEAEAEPLANYLNAPSATARSLLDRVLHWTHGHPYLTQRFCRAIVESNVLQAERPTSDTTPLVDELCDKLFLSPRAREQDDNLLFVRERLLRTDLELTGLLGVYEQVLKGERVLDDETDERINQLRLSGIVDVSEGQLRPRNRIYERVYDQAWVDANVPDAELEKPGGGRVRLRSTCTLGRASTSDVVLADTQVSRRHALIQAQKQSEFWLLDLGSSNGTYLNGRRLARPTLLCDRDVIEVGPFRLTFFQSRGHPARDSGEKTTAEQTIFVSKQPLR